MAVLLRSPITAVWGLLTALTLASWSIGTNHAFEDARVGSVLVLLVAFLKVRFVGRYFMELRHAPILLRMVFEGWCAGVCTVVIVLYLLL